MGKVPAELPASFWGMMVIVEQRASIILYNVLNRIEDKKKPFLLPANVCPIVPLTYIKAGVAFELVDISPDSLCMDESIVIDKISKNLNSYNGVHYVRTYGVEDAPKDFFRNLKKLQPNLFVIDDKCLNIPKFFDGELSEEVDLLFFSTGYSKFVDIGWGGFGYLNRRHEYHRVDLPFHQDALIQMTATLKQKLEDKSPFIYQDSCWLGDTSVKIDGQAYRELVQKTAPIVVDSKREINSIYSKGLVQEIQLSNVYQNWRFNIRVPQRDRLIREIFKKGFFASAHYGSVSTLFGQPTAKSAEAANKDIVNLFNDFRVDANAVRKIIDIVNEHLEIFNINY